MANEAPSQASAKVSQQAAVKEEENEPEVPDVSLLDFCAQLEDYTPTVNHSILTISQIPLHAYCEVGLCVKIAWN